MTSDDYPYWTYDELHDLDYMMSQIYLVTGFDADDLEYPPADYWDEIIAYCG